MARNSYTSAKKPKPKPAKKSQRVTVGIPKQKMPGSRQGPRQK